MPSVTLLLELAAFVLTIASAAGKSPLWPAVLLIDVALLLEVLAR